MPSPWRNTSGVGAGAGVGAHVGVVASFSRVINLVPSLSRARRGAHPAKHLRLSPQPPPPLRKIVRLIQPPWYFGVLLSTPPHTEHGSPRNCRSIGGESFGSLTPLTPFEPFECESSPAVSPLAVSFRNASYDELGVSPGDGVLDGVRSGLDPSLSQYVTPVSPHLCQVNPQHRRTSPASDSAQCEYA